MTFFANAGVKWPSIQTELREAGTETLSGGATLWRLFSKIEGRESDDITTLGEDAALSSLKTNCVNALRAAADTYSSNLNSIGTTLVDGLTSAELDLAALPRRYYDYQFLVGPFNIRDLYSELIVRIRNLASQVNTLNVAYDRRDLTFQVFRAMKKWELISSLARLIAVLNRRPDESHIVP